VTVAELRAALAAYPDDAPVVAVWEMCSWGVAVYEAPGGVVVIDADGEQDREDIEAGRLVLQVPPVS
jgi:hypothetical protein